MISETAGFKIILENFPGDPEYKVLHAPQKFAQKILEGKLTQTLTGIDSMSMSISLKNKYYDQLHPYTSHIKVINLRDNTLEFYGRVLRPVASMNHEGFMKTFVCESILGYLNDSNQMFQRVLNTGPADYFIKIIECHNAQVEPHKRFKIGNITVKSSSDVPIRYIGYESTFDTIKEYCLGKMGGFVRLRLEKDGNYLDYLEEVGTLVNSPIQLGKNIMSATRSVNLDGLITRIVPLGSDLDTGKIRDDENGQYVIRQRVGIASVNNGVDYLEDAELVKKFGIIQKAVNWTNISSPSILKARGQQYMDNQKVSLASWSVESPDLYLIDPRYKKFVVGNKHPIINPPLSGIESLQIIKKETNILLPNEVSLEVGSDPLTMASFQLQQAEAFKSMEKELKNAEARRKEEERINTELTLLKSELAQIESNEKMDEEEKIRVTNQLSYLNTLLATGLDPGARQAILLQKSDSESSLASINKRLGENKTRKEEINVRLAELEKQKGEINA